MSRPTLTAAELAEALGCTIDEAAQKIAERDERDAVLAETKDPELLLPAIRDELKLHAKVERIVKTVSSPPHYRIETDCGSVHLGPSSKWATRPGDFSAAFLDTIGYQPTVPTGQRRLALNSMIARAAEEEDIGEEATDVGWVRSVLRSYLAMQPPVDNREEASTTEYPWLEGDRVAVFGRSVDKHVRFTFMQKPTPAELGKMLRAVGCEPFRAKITTCDGKPTTRSAWLLPADLDG